MATILDCPLRHLRRRKALPAHENELQYSERETRVGEEEGGKGNRSADPTPLHHPNVTVVVRRPQPCCAGQAWLTKPAESEESVNLRFDSSRGDSEARLGQSRSAASDSAPEPDSIAHGSEVLTFSPNAPGLPSWSFEEPSCSDSGGHNHRDTLLFETPALLPHSEAAASSSWVRAELISRLKASNPPRCPRRDTGRFVRSCRTGD